MYISEPQDRHEPFDAGKQPINENKLYLLFLDKTGLWKSKPHEVGPNSNLLSEDKIKHTWNLQKKKNKHLKDPQTLRNKILCPDEPKF